MKITPIRSDADLDSALERVGDLMDRDVDPASREGDELEILSILIRSYEDARWPVELPTPLGAIRFRMEQQGLDQKDLVPYFGSRSKVSEVLAGKRPLSLNMIRRLHEGLSIPLDVLVQPKIGKAIARNTRKKLNAGSRSRRESHRAAGSRR